MEQLLVGWLFLFAISTIACAAPNETETALETRYGKSIKRFEPRKGVTRSTMVVYRTATLEIKVWFIEGTSQHEEFTKLKDEAFTKPEILALLKANAPAEVSWIDVHSEIGGDSWRRSDLRALASTSPGDKTLSFITINH